MCEEFSCTLCFSLGLREGSVCLWPVFLNLFYCCVHTISALLPLSSLQCLPPHIFIWSRYSMSLTSFPKSFLLLCPYHLSLASSSSLQCLPPHIFIWSRYSMSLTSFPKSFLLLCPYHLSLASSSSLQCLPPHIFIWSRYSMSLTSFPKSFLLLCPYRLSLVLHLLCNVYHLTSSSDLVIPCLWPVLLNRFYWCVHTISALLPLSSLQCLPPHIFIWSRYSMSLTSSPKSFLLMCPYHISIASLIFFAMSTTSHLHLISLFHVSDQFS